MASLNEVYGVTEVYQHDFDDNSRKCKKCHKHISELVGSTTVCPVIGPEEVAQFRDYDSR